MRARFPRFAPSCDDEFLFEKELEFPPVRRALARHVARGRHFCDEPLPAVLDGALVQRASVAVRNLADAQNRRAGIAEDVLEALPAFEERLIAKIRRAG